MKKILSAVVLSLALYVCEAQTKVFKEVGAEIYSQVKAIRQDNALVGYLVFTQLEKASADSFNYKITLIDENLNDIGVVTFREQNLYLYDVSFDQDVLCLAYRKSNFTAYEFKSKRAYRDAMPNAKTSVLVQFISLDGKIIKSNTLTADVAPSKDPIVNAKKIYGTGYLKFNPILRNIPGKGFACFYGDDTKKSLLVFKPTGDQFWKKTITQDANSFWLSTTSDDIYIMSKQSQADGGGYELLGYNVNDSSAYPKHVLKDKKGNSLQVITFDYDPVTRKPYVSGYIINQDKPLEKHIYKGAYAGVFTININGHNKGDINEVYSYWIDGSQSNISPKGRMEDTKTYVKYVTCFRDFEGNTWYTGTSFAKKTRVGGIIVSVVFAPLFYPTFVELLMGYTKIVDRAPVFLKQNPKGGLAVNNISDAGTGISNYFSHTNPDTKTAYVVMQDYKNFYVYNINQKKITRTIPRGTGGSLITIFPAKEGHVAISEYNANERYTRVSIEAL